MKKFLAIGALTLALTGAAAAGITATSVIRADDAADTAQTAICTAIPFFTRFI